MNTNCSFKPQKRTNNKCKGGGSRRQADDSGSVCFSKTTSNCKFYIDILVQQVCIICHIRRYVEINYFHHFRVKYFLQTSRTDLKASKFVSGVQSICRAPQRPGPGPRTGTKDRDQGPGPRTGPSLRGVSWCCVRMKKGPEESHCDLSSSFCFNPLLRIKTWSQHLNNCIWCFIKHADIFISLEGR